jgi:prephenate dehydratase
MKMFALGPVGTNGHEAASLVLHKLGGAKSEAAIEQIQLCRSHVEVFRRAVEETGYAVVPIENSISGLVADTIHGFWLQHKSQPAITVLGEISLPIAHVLVTRYAKMFDTSMSVLSHPQALSQCRENLEWLGLTNLVPTRSTAEAGALVAHDDRYAHSAALISPFAAQRYQLKVHRLHMEDTRSNTTRFHVLGHSEWPVGDNCKTALIFWTENKPRAMVNAVWAISADGADMSSFHSLPLGVPGQFAFYVEFDEHEKSPKGKDIMDRLKTVTSRILRLGSFPSVLPIDLLPEGPFAVGPK